MCKQLVRQRIREFVKPAMSSCAAGAVAINAGSMGTRQADVANFCLIVKTLSARVTFGNNIAPRVRDDGPGGLSMIPSVCRSFGCRKVGSLQTTLAFLVASMPFGAALDPSKAAAFAARPGGCRRFGWRNGRFPSTFNFQNCSRVADRRRWSLCPGFDRLCRGQTRAVQLSDRRRSL